MFSLPAYGALTAFDAPALARTMKAQRSADEMVWGIGLWGAVLPAIVMLLLVRWAADRLEPGYGTAAAMTLGLGTLLLPLGTLLFSHVLAACLGFAAFVLLFRERDGPPQLWPVAAAGALIGFAMTTEYALLFSGIVLGVYALLRGPRVRRALVFVGGGAVGIAPLAIYNQAVYGSITHVAYSDLAHHQSGFFGIRLPSATVAIALLGDSRGLLTLQEAADLGCRAIAGIVVLYRRGRRAEALVIAGIGVLYLLYNSGYFLPFGGGSPGPRYLTPVLPFLAVALAVAFRRFPGPALALAVASATAYVAITLTHPLIGYESETGIWTRLLSKGFFQPTIVSALGSSRGWIVVVPFLLLAGAAVVLAATVTPLRLGRRDLLWGAVAVGAWALYAALGPSVLGLDHAAELRIVAAGDPTATTPRAGPHPLANLALLSLAATLVAMMLAWLGPLLRARTRRIR